MPEWSPGACGADGVAPWRIGREVVRAAWCAGEFRGVRRARASCQLHPAKVWAWPVSQLLFLGGCGPDIAHTQGGADAVEVADTDRDPKALLNSLLEGVAGRMGMGLAM